MLQSSKELVYHDSEPVVDFLGAGVDRKSTRLNSSH